MKQIPLDERKQLQLDLLVKIDEICREQGFRYYLTAGTLLGAVRHGGYIPWDDDIDITMPRRDYEAFYSYMMKNDFGDSIKLISYRDRSSIYPFFKVVDPRTTVIEHYVDRRYCTGVWVDIFPLDGIEQGDRSPIIWNKIIANLYGFVVADPAQGTSASRKAIKHLTNPVFRHIDIYRLAKALDKKAMSTLISPENDVALVVWGYGESEIMPYEFLEQTELEFEGINFYAPKMYKQYLTSIFGNYMQLPPEKDRVPHFCSAYWNE